MDLNEFMAISKSLSDPNRVRALMALRFGELCLCQLIELLSLAPSTVSKHMSILKQARLVQSRKDSRWVYYRLAVNTEDKNHLSRIIDISISILEQDKQIRNDDKKMAKPMSEGLEAICKNQRCTKKD